MASANLETPDAIGWNGGSSILVECKISRSDFFRNADKPSHRAGMGMQRYFMVPAGLVAAPDMERFAEWGLLYVRDSGNVQTWIAAPLLIADSRAEIRMLVSTLRRVRTREFLTLNVLPKDSPEPADVTSS